MPIKLVLQIVRYTANVIGSGSHSCLCSVHFVDMINIWRHVVSYDRAAQKY